FRMPSAERRASDVHCTSLRNVAACDSVLRASEPKFRVLQVRFEAFIKEPGFTKNFGAEQYGSKRRRRDLTLAIEWGRVDHSGAGAPRGRAARREIERRIQRDPARPIGAENL